ncbi:hypothetical protein [Methylobacterium sp. WL103]|uniref:hypothetical protein n=1 Tax=Methylobacterium sp. WL103 TaxID=2603891 RepID=UPI0016509DEB|nr:hypothetical protein [Methylobacterium sp. WL103]
MAVIITVALLVVWLGFTAFLEWRDGKQDQALAVGVPAIFGLILIALNLLGVHA